MTSASPGPRVLIVEDHHDTADLLGRYARLLNCETRIAHSAAEASARAAEFRPQIILLDIGLPDMDGWELARNLRDELQPVRPVMIAITCYTRPEDRQRSKQAGIDFHLNKPAFQSDLMRILRQFGGRN